MRCEKIPTVVAQNAQCQACYAQNSVPIKHTKTITQTKNHNPNQNANPKPISYSISKPKERETERTHMGIVLKHTFKNIWSKPFRTLMLVICILFASFTAALAFDMSNSIVNILRSAFTSMVGDANAYIVCPQGMDETAFDGTESYDKEYVMLSAGNLEIYLDNDDEFTYNKRTLEIFSAQDQDMLNKLHLTAKEVVLGDSDMVICKKYAEEFHLQIGDQVTLDGEEGATATFTIVDIQPCFGVLETGYSVLISEAGMKNLTAEQDIDYQLAFVKLANEKEVKDFCKDMTANLPMARIENMVDGKMVTEEVDSITTVFYFIFIIALLLVIFVTISLSERIMVERMSTIGTLRSLGVSTSATTVIVLLENVFYGLLGGVLGVMTYALIRDPMFNSIFSISSGSDIELEMNLGSVSTLTMVLVVLGTIAVECFCPIKELLRAVKTPIRDIIFDNKDTAFKYSKITLFASIILACVSVPCVVLSTTIMRGNIPVIVTGMICGIAALFLGYPHLLRGACKLLSKFCEKFNKPVAQMACIQASTKKSSVANSRLCVMSVTMCLLLLLIVAPLSAIFGKKEAECDVVVTGLSEEREAYEFIKEIPGVSDVEYYYVIYANTVVGTSRIEEYLSPNRATDNPNFELDEILMCGMDGEPKMLQTLVDVPKTVGDDEIIITETLAERYDLEVGENLEILFNPQGQEPVRKNFTIAGLYNSTYSDTSNDTFLINQNTYRAIYKDYPNEVFVRCEDPETVKKTIEKYASNLCKEVYTIDEFQEMKEQSNAGLNTLFYVIIGVGVAMTVVSIISNQIVAFEGRKRETAVLISTAMSKGKVKKMFLLESLISSVLAILLALGIALGLRSNLMDLVKWMSFVFPDVLDIPGLLTFCGIMLLVFTLTILRPIKQVRKMKTAEQLKYE